ncbi:MAG: UDP-N-acetylmuramoyl-L-alanine--D-glutamate ligase [Planctomycetota bacterium]
MPTDPGSYAGRRATVMGLGRFGGGVGVARFLVERGAHVLVTDTAPAADLADSVAKLADLEPGHPSGGTLTYRLGGHDKADFTGPDLLVVNPAVKPGNPYVAAARAAGVPVTSEIRLLARHLPNRLKTIGITGTAGKSTTTAMTAHILRKVLCQPGETPYGGHMQRQIESPGVWMGGNLGGSLLPAVDLIRDDDWVVLELSSFMLEGLREDRWSPHIAVITNISPNHLDWHGSMENYVAAKQAILEFQQHDDIAYVGESFNEALGVETGSAARSYVGWKSGNAECYRHVLAPREEDVVLRLSIPGWHNQLNAVFASHVGEEVLSRGPGNSCTEGVNLQLQIMGAIESFAGLPHRLERVGQFLGVEVFNDSKSTTPEATELVVWAFPPRRVRLILGGYDKGARFDNTAEFVAIRCASAYTIGATGNNIAEQIRAHSGVVTCCQSLEVAVPTALQDAKPGDVLVLSPGCASWDQFANYEERGERFVELVQQHAAAKQKKPTD